MGGGGGGGAGVVGAVALADEVGEGDTCDGFGAVALLIALAADWVPAAITPAPMSAVGANAGSFKYN